MEVLTNISLHDQYFDMVIDKILETFYKCRQVYEKKSELIVRKLCSQLNGGKVFSTVALKLQSRYRDLDAWFVS
jgi:vacuole morphology and inheritance protein 14